MVTETKTPLTSWECYTPDMFFLNCQACAEEFARENSLDIKGGMHPYADGPAGYGVAECYACGHETDYPLSCDGCGQYLKGDLTEEGVAYLKLGKFPKWLRDYYLTDYRKQFRRELNK
jgi:hypothetical protein